MLKDVIEDIGVHNVMKVVNDNGSAYVIAEKVVMKKYQVYWTSCAAHCIDVMFEDIGKRPIIVEPVAKARNITKFIYNHLNVLATMGKLCFTELIHPGKHDSR